METNSRDNWIQQSMGSLAELEERQQDLESELASTKEPAKRRELQKEITRLDGEIRGLYAAIESVVRGNKAAQAQAAPEEDEDDDYASTAIFQRDDYTEMLQEILDEDGKGTPAKSAESIAAASMGSSAAATVPRGEAAEGSGAVARSTGRGRVGSGSGAAASTSEVSPTASQSLGVSRVEERALAHTRTLKRNITIAIWVGAAGFVAWIIWLAS